MSWKLDDGPSQRGDREPSTTRAARTGGLNTAEETTRAVHLGDNPVSCAIREPGSITKAEADVAAVVARVAGGDLDRAEGGETGVGGGGSADEELA